MNLIKGDCLEKLKDISSNSVDCFICDLPYGTTGCKWDKKIDLDLLWNEFKRIARSNHTPYFFFCDMKLAVDLIISNRKWFRYEMIIDKKNVCGFLNSKKMPMKKHELLLVFYKNLPIYNVDKYHTCENKGHYEDLKSDVYGNMKRKEIKKYIPSLPHTILQMNNNSTKRFHPTEKTQDILEWIIKYYSNEGDTILDATMGSGSTGVACKTLNRKFIGIELDEKYFEIASSRIFPDPK
jgi:site-specific DNA-methyltransferase (adenine-specific)